MERFEHGGNSDPDILFDFSANINPLGLPKSVKRLLTESVDKFSKYPDPDCAGLVEKISEYENIPREKIVCGNGAADLIHRIVLTVKPERALLLAPTFSEYEKALCEIGCKVRFHNLREDENFRVTKRLLNDLHDADLFFLCNPNNPTGSIVDPILLKEIYFRCKKENIFFVVDECFLSFAEMRAEYAFQVQSGSAVLKAFTKLYAMAGLRLGYMIFGDNSLADKVRRTGQCWSVSVPAQIAGEAALSENEYVRKTIETISKEREFLNFELSSLGIKVYPSSVNFLLICCKLPLEKLIRKYKIAIRSCENFIGLNENYFRIAVRGHEENIALIKAIKNIMNMNGGNG